MCHLIAMISTGVYGRRLRLYYYKGRFQLLYLPCFINIYMIKNIIFKFAAGGSLEITPTYLTIFIGPNNSGKSLALREIAQFCKSGGNIGNLLVDKLEFQTLSDDKRHTFLEQFESFKTSGNNIEFGNDYLDYYSLLHQFSESAPDPVYWAKLYLYGKIGHLDALNRISLTNSARNEIASSNPNEISRLYRTDDERAEVRNILLDAFQKYFVLDIYSNAAVISIKFSENPPKSVEFERSLTEEYIDYISKATSIADLSDGVKAFTGILVSSITTSKKIILIDEPEAFLHPSLSFKLGKVLADKATKNDCQYYISTHSSSFIMGALHSGVPITIVRMNFENKLGSSRILENAKLRELMKNPLLRSTGVIDALFYKHVVVCEGDSDRAFYQEINERLNELDSDRGILDCLFMNAQGKDTVWRIVKLLREMGINAVGIYDLDILKNEHTNWNNAMISINMPQQLRESVATTRKSVKKSFDDNGLDMNKDSGIVSLNRENKEVAEHLLAQLETYGMFVVPYGEVEQWLRYLEVQAHKSEWLPKMFERMGSDSADSNYVKPRPDDVWNFIFSIKKWMTNDKKKGTFN
jgi:ABC-type polar amino acid transport system ATPase subunit